MKSQLGMTTENNRI